jgi:hypothetical protein
LKDRPSGDVAIEILDASGKTIQIFRRPAEPGMNRFEWDLRHPDARGLPGRTYLMGGSLRGPVAAPGSYQVKLTVGEKVSTRPFEIRKDPRIATTTEDFEKQLELLLRIRDRLSETHQAIATALDLKEQIHKMDERAGDRAELAEVSVQARGLGEKLQELLDGLYEPRFTGVDDQLLLFPLKLNARLASLGGVVSSADRAPTSAAYEVFRELSAQLEPELSKLQRILSSELPALNRLAQEKGMSIVF